MSMTAVPMLRNGFLHRELIAIAGSSLVVLVALLLRVVMLQQYSGSWWPLISILPWLVISTTAAWAIRSSSTLKLGLAAFVCVVPAIALGPNLIFHLSPFSGRSLPWGNSYFTFFLQDLVFGTEYDPENFLGTVSNALEILGLLFLIASLVWLLVSISPYLLSKAPRTSFGIDTSLLIFAFAIISLFFQSVPWGLSDAFGPDAFLALITLSWALPMIILLALFVRHGGAMAIGAAVGVLVAGWVFNLFEAIVQRINGDGESTQITDNAVFKFESMPRYGIIPILLLVVVTIWWAMTRGAGGNPSLNVSTSASPINGTSIVAFCLAWIPLTAIPALILGHMAFDQIADGDHPQRGIGLARWSIFISYISILAGIVVAFNWIG